ncbi:LysR family transcriptional regulator [Pelagibius marinus]|uniref:LysR family transcriptional regulator n=1 Tax=Pelagibius marinus TaxID=2762760 RepID=UPI001872A47A|nr:LysR family transcriptional regulator [Pelagibius marinus]
MELQQVRYFVTLCKTLNFTRAAELCNVTQPSLTRAIQALEAEFGGPLLHRERNKTHLTDLGQIVRPYLEGLLDQASAVKNRAKEFTQMKDVSLSLGLMCTIGPHRLIGLMRNYRERYPGVELTLRDATAETLHHMLDEGEIDVALLAFPGETPDRFHALPLYVERFVIAFAPGHEFESLNAVRLRDLHQKLYLSRVNCEFGDQMLELYAQRGIEPIRPYRSERDDWIISMAAAGLGFSFIPEFSVTVPGVKTRPLVDPEVARTVSLATVRGRPHSPAVGAFVREARTTQWDETTVH